jgi:hypothetical protein
MIEDRKGAADQTDRKSRSGEGATPDEVSTDDRHKTEKLARHDGLDPNEGQD